MPRRSTVTRLGRVVAAALLGVLTLAPLAGTGYALDPGPGTEETTPADTPTPTETIPEPSPTPTDATPTDTPAPSPTPEPPTTGPATIGPTGPNRIVGITVMAGNAVLGPAYWAGNTNGSFAITVKNTGTLAARMNLRYTVPTGVSDVATGACAHGSCLINSLEPGRVATLTVAISVNGDAWRNAPLAGRVDFTATAGGYVPVSDSVNWGVIFPPGPPAAGIGLQVADVTLDADATVAGQLVIRLTNTGVRAAVGVLDLVVPAGVSVGELPADCQNKRQVDASTVECGLGPVAAGVQRAISIPLQVSDEARADAPLAGLVRAALTPSGQGTRTTQASYQIIAPQVQSGVSAASTASPAVPQPAGNASATGGDPAAKPIIFGSVLLLVLVALGLIVGVRGRGLPGLGRRRFSASATTGPWRPVATFAPPLPRREPEPAVPAGREHAAGPEVADGAEPVWPEEPDRTDRTGRPIGLGQINLEWTELPDSTPPPGSPTS